MEITAGQAVKLAMEYGEYFVPLSPAGDHRVTLNRVNAAARRTKAKFKLEKVLVTHTDLSTQLYLKVTLKQD